MARWYCNVGGQQYGPVDLDALRQWMREGRLTASDLVWTEGWAQWQPAGAVPGLGAASGPGAPSTAPPPLPAFTQPTGPSYLKPHRGTAILVLSILGWVVCIIMSVIAYVMANNDLREMDAGLMDPAGRGMTQAGKIISMIQIIIVVVALFMFIILGLFAAAAA